MDILFCAPDRITKTLGAPKVYVEVAEALRDLGCTCTIVGREDVAPDVSQFDSRRERTEYYSRKLRDYIRWRADDFDVIEYEHEYLPFPRQSFPEDTLLVARSVLLACHARDIHLPMWSGIPRLVQLLAASTWENPNDVSQKCRARILKKHVGEVLRYETERWTRRRYASRATKTCKAANAHDRHTLEKEGIPTEKMVTLPFGLSKDRFQSLASARPDDGSLPTVVFVGTYDFRKGGATDLPRIAERIHRKCPSVRFRLLGTSGLFVDREEVLAHFASSLHDQIEVVPKYDPEELPELLDGGAIGIFPSYFEGFPFGVLEMQAAGLPVVAYEAPGPPEMLPETLLAPLGDWVKLAQNAIALLQEEGLENRQQEARRRAKSFKWKDVAKRTLAAYEKRMNVQHSQV
jgi:glycosyltransferase involved in cell wall biosynthesis